MNFRQQFQPEHILKQFLTEVFLWYKCVFLGRTGSKVLADGGVRLFCSCRIQCTVPALYTGNFPLDKCIMLQIIFTVFTMLIAQCDCLPHLFENKKVRSRSYAPKNARSDCCDTISSHFAQVCEKEHAFFPKEKTHTYAKVLNNEIVSQGYDSINKCQKQGKSTLYS